MEKSEYWRGNDGFSLVPEVKVTLLIDSSMVFFANFSGISMVGGWIYRNVFLLVIDSTKLSLFVLFVVRGRVQKSAQSEGRKGRKGVSMNNDTIMTSNERNFLKILRYAFDNNNKWKRTLRPFVLAESWSASCLLRVVRVSLNKNHK